MKASGAGLTSAASDPQAGHAGVRVLRDPFSAKPYILFYTAKRVDRGVQGFDAIKLLKFAVS